MEGLNRKIQELRFRELDAGGRLVAFCRNLETQLRDMNANNTADRLAALLGEIDAIEADGNALVQSDTAAFIALLRETLKRG